jgi:hypothetical protein
MAIELISKVKPKNNGTFAIADAEDIAYKEGRLPDYLPLCMTQDEYDSLKAAGKLNDNTPYLIVEGDE